VLETLIGAGVGVVVNAVLVPPVYVRPAGEAIYELADDMARVLEGAAADLAEGWSGEDAYERLQEARELDREVGRPGRRSARPRTACASTPGGGQHPRAPGQPGTPAARPGQDPGRTWPGTSPTPDLRPSASAASLPWW
jgi:hypothetical protein